MITDKHFADWESHVFGFGYGTGESFTLHALKNFLAATHDDGTYDYRELEAAVTGTVAWLLLNTLCHADDILDYGTSPRFGWLDKKGKILREYVAGKTSTELYDIVMRGDNNGCYPTHCNCTTPCNNPLFEGGR